jgi:Glutathione S-transferase, C-terminal domain
MQKRLDQLEERLRDREWLVADRFTAADLLMADVLRVSALRSFCDRPATEAYVTRATSRPAFGQARADANARETRPRLPTPPSPYDGDTSPSRNPRRGGEMIRRRDSPSRSCAG